jgi:hypothetical protein
MARALSNLGASAAAREILSWEDHLQRRVGNRGGGIRSGESPPVTTFVS